MSIQELLNQLADIRSMLDVLRVDRDAAIALLLTPEVKAAISDIESEFLNKVESAQANASELEAKIKKATVDAGVTVKGERLQAVYVSPKITWDAKSLDGYAMAHPELFAFRKEGEASVQIRVVK